MRKMKDSGIEWIGEIPEDWKTTKLKHILLKNDGGVWGKDANGVNDRIVLRSTEQLIDGTLCINNPALRQLSNDEYNSSVLKEGDILLTKSSGSISHIGKSSYITKEIENMKCCYSNFMQRIRLKNVYPKLYFYMMNNVLIKEQLNYLSTTTTGLNNISASLINNLFVTLPEKNEQELIVDYLDKKVLEINNIISKTQETIEEYKKYKQSVITEAVTKGLNPNVEMKDSGIEWIGEIPKDWENRKLITLLSQQITDGPHETPELLDDGIPFISAEAIKQDRIDFSKKRGYISKEASDIYLKKYKPKLHDIFMVKSGATTGNMAIVETEELFNIWSPLAVIRCNKNTYYKYLFYAMYSDYFKKQIQLSWSYGTQQNLGMRNLEQLRVLIPKSYDQQLEIATFIDKKIEKVNNLITKKQELITQLEAYKKSLIYECVTGKKEVALAYAY